MKKVLLFGSGNGAKEFLLKYENEIDVIGIIDNDKNKHGKEFLKGLKISSPHEIKKFNYEKIIIVSQWAKEIKNQLVNEILISQDKIQIPAKKDIKKAIRPFEDSNTKALAREIIEKLSKNAIDDNIALLLDFGTLLGVIRDNDIISWDDDIDFSIVNLDPEVDFTKWIRETILKINLPVKLSIKSQDNISYLMSFKSQEYNSFLISISLREIENDRYNHLPSGGMWYAPRKYFDNYEEYMWNNKKVLIPSYSKSYLEFLYGDWEKPKKDMSMTDYNNLADEKYSEFIESEDKYKEVL